MTNRTYTQNEGNVPPKIKAKPNARTEALPADAVMPADPNTLSKILANPDTQTRFVSRNRQYIPITFEVVRELTPDLILESKIKIKRKARRLKQIRQSHHIAAQLIAQGKRTPDVALATGYTVGYLHRLQTDPAFMDLVSYYSTKVEHKLASTLANMKNILDDTLCILLERIHEDHDEMSVTELSGVVKLMADRVGYAPVTKNIQVQASLDDNTLNDIKTKIKENQHGKTNTVSADETAPPAIEADYKLAACESESASDSVQESP